MILIWQEVINRLLLLGLLVELLLARFKLGAHLSLRLVLFPGSLVYICPHLLILIHNHPSARSEDGSNAGEILRRALKVSACLDFLGLLLTLQQSESQKPRLVIEQRRGNAQF